MKHADLIARLEKLTGPDREVDALIQCMEVPRISDLLPHWSAADIELLIPHFTASLDAAVALLERMLPGWTYLLNNDGGNSADLFPPNWPHGKNFDATGASMPVAIVLALLRALQESDPAAKT